MQKSGRSVTARAVTQPEVRRRLRRNAGGTPGTLFCASKLVGAFSLMLSAGRHARLSGSTHGDRDLTLHTCCCQRRQQSSRPHHQRTASPASHVQCAYRRRQAPANIPGHMHSAIQGTGCCASRFKARTLFNQVQDVPKILDHRKPKAPDLHQPAHQASGAKERGAASRPAACGLDRQRAVVRQPRLMLYAFTSAGHHALVQATVSAVTDVPPPSPFRPAEPPTHCAMGLVAVGARCRSARGTHPCAGTR